MSRKRIRIFINTEPPERALPVIGPEEAKAIRSATDASAALAKACYWLVHGARDLDEGRRNEQRLECRVRAMEVVELLGPWRSLFKKVAPHSIRFGKGGYAPPSPRRREELVESIPVPVEPEPWEVPPPSSQGRLTTRTQPKTSRQSITVLVVIVLLVTLAVAVRVLTQYFASSRPDVTERHAASTPASELAQVDANNSAAAEGERLLARMCTDYDVDPHYRTAHMFGHKMVVWVPDRMWIGLSASQKASLETHLSDRYTSWGIGVGRVSGKDIMADRLVVEHN